jgi:hypothetical protein
MVYRYTPRFYDKFRLEGGPDVWVSATLDVEVAPRQCGRDEVASVAEAWQQCKCRMVAWLDEQARSSEEAFAARVARVSGPSPPCGMASPSPGVDALARRVVPPPPPLPPQSRGSRPQSPLRGASNASNKAGSMTVCVT